MIYNKKRLFLRFNSYLCSMIQATPSLGFVEAINASTSKLFQFQGRSRRSEFWWTQLLVYGVSLVLTPFVGGVLGLLTIPLTFRRLHDTGRSGWWWGVGALLMLVFFIILGYDCVMAIMNAENLEDFDSYLAIGLLLKYGILTIVIGVYQVVLLVLCCLDSDQSENQYGPSPKYVDDGNLVP